MKITGAKSFVLTTPVGREIADSMQSVTNLEIVGLTIATDDGLSGTGYTVTVGHGGRVIQAVLDTLYIDDLTGRDPHDVRQIWSDLYYGKAHWIGRAGATTMAQSAVDIALWDLIAQAAQQPLWRVLGGARAGDVAIYNTHAGWLNFSTAQLQDEALRLLDRGYTALKMKVGLPDLAEDVSRVRAVRQAIGANTILMVDANQKWDLVRASDAAQRLAECELSWLEEPLHPDDVEGHRQLRERSSIPIALGEHVYTTHAFRDFVAARAVDIVQVDVCRIGGITPWLEVAALAHTYGLRVCPHAGDLMQVHQHLVRAIPNSWFLEVIPLWDEGPFVHQVQLEDGRCRAPLEPGASTAIRPAAMQKFRTS